MPGSDLVLNLQALQAHLECTQEKLHQLLLQHTAENEGFSLSTFNNYLNNRHKRARHQPRIAKALDACAKANNYDIAEIVGRHTARPNNVVTRTAGRRLAAHLRGAWFLVQYRGKRNARNDVVANDDYRVGVLVYGADKERGREFQLVGQSTLWEGRVTMHPEDPILYYTAEEKQRVDIKEWVRLLMHAPFVGGETGDHHGIVVGIGRGPHDSPIPPIYASRVLLSRIAGEGAERMKAPLSQPDIGKLKALCGYFPRPGILTPAEADGIDTEMLEERNKAIRSFGDRSSDTAKAQGNFGERIFVRL